MRHRVYDEDAFDERVRHAKQCILSGHTDSREYETCFEMCDGNLVVLRLLQEAETTAALLTTLERYDIAWIRNRLYPLLKHAEPSEIADLAKTLRDDFEGRARAMWPELCSDE